MWNLCLSILAYHSKAICIEDFIKWSSSKTLQDSPCLLLDMIPDGKLKSYLLKHPDWHQQALDQIQKYKRKIFVLFIQDMQIILKIFINYLTLLFF